MSDAIGPAGTAIIVGLMMAFRIARYISKRKQDKAAAQKRERYARDLLKKGKGKMPPYIKTFKQSETFLFVIIKDHFDDLRENCGDLEDASGQACYVNGVDKLYNKIIPLMKSMVKRCKDTDKPKRCKEDWEDEIKTYQKDLEKIKRRYR